jgi:hypothetical protein
MGVPGPSAHHEAIPFGDQGCDAIAMTLAVSAPKAGQDQCAPGCSRSLKRWIFPVAVLGRSATNSITRGYL